MAEYNEKGKLTDFSPAMKAVNAENVSRASAAPPAWLPFWKASHKA
jgi:hypothetical protein